MWKPFEQSSRPAHVLCTSINMSASDVIAFFLKKGVPCLYNEIVLETERSFSRNIVVKKSSLESSNSFSHLEEKEEIVTAWVALFGFGVYFLLLVLAATMVIAFIGAKYCK